jgi:hypothetical protein
MAIVSLLYSTCRGAPTREAPELRLLELRIERGERGELSGRLVQIKPRRTFAR